MKMMMRERVLWFVGGALAVLVFVWLPGGLYTITPPNGPVDVAYKMNRLTGRVWLIKTYSKPVGTTRVLAARQAAVEATKDIADFERTQVARVIPRTLGARRGG